MKVVLHSGASSELEDAEEWYEAQREGLGEDLSAEVEQALDVIRESPMTWPRWPDSPPTPFVRRFLLSRFPFALAYIAEPDRIVVVAVAHTRRRPGYWFSRLKRFS